MDPYGICIKFRAMPDEDQKADEYYYLQAVMNTVLDGVITIDDKGIIQTFNPAAVRMFGYTPAEVIGKNVKVLMPDPYHTEHDGYIRNYLNTQKAKVIGIGREVTAKRKDGSIFPMELGINEAVVRGKKMFVGTTKDISERKKAEEQLLDSNLELERFAYVASHDLKEPMRMVSNFTSLLNAEYSHLLDETAQEYMAFILDASTRMQAMITDLLDYARINSDAADLQEVDCNLQLDITLSNLSEEIKESNARITYEPLPVIWGNALRILRLLQNLIGNAIKYRAPDRAPRIHISAEDQDETWLFCVEDNGIGIKAEYLEQIFIIFKRLHGKSDYQGTGIGLAICKKVVESLNGKIWVESEFGKGSKFFFSFYKHQQQIRGETNEYNRV